MRNALDNLALAKDPDRTLPAFIAIAVQNGGNDGKNSERGLEYDTMSDRLARFINDEVLPAVLNNADIKVLLVDDDKMIRDCIMAYLEDEGFTVHCADSGETGLESISFLRPLVCISDMRLPGMDGEEFIVKAHAISPATGYLLHTGMLYSLSDELRAIGMNSDDILLKPIHELAKLVDKIRHIAAARRMM